MSTAISYRNHQFSWDSAQPGSNSGPEQIVTSNYFPGGLYQPQFQGPLSTNISATSGTNHSYPADGYLVPDIGALSNIHHQFQTQTQLQQFSTMASNGGIDEMPSGCLQFPPQPMLPSQGQGVDGGYIPWSGQMSSLDNQQYEQNPVVAYDQSQQQYNQNLVDPFAQSQQSWAMPNGLGQVTVDFSSLPPPHFDGQEVYGWDGQIDSLSCAQDAQSQQPCHASSIELQLAHVGPASQIFSIYPQQFHQLDSQQFSRPSSSQSSAPDVPPTVEKKRKKASPKGKGKAAPKGSSEKRKRTPPKNKGKAAAKGSSEDVIPSSSTPPPPVSAPSNKRRREEENGEELHSQVPTKRARTITPIPRLIPPPAIPMTRDVRTSLYFFPLRY